MLLLLESAVSHGATRPPRTTRNAGADTRRMRGASKPFVMSNLKTLAGVAEVVRFIEERGMLTSGG